MSELPHVHLPEESLKSGKVVDLDLVRESELVNTLYGHHCEDYDGMLPEEKSAYLAHLRHTSEIDKNPEVRAAAKKFLLEIDTTGKGEK